MSESTVLLASVFDRAALQAVFTPYALNLELLDTDAEIPGSFWGAPEAGLIADKLFYRLDTPVHSIFHEACHYICMDDTRRDVLHTNAGGTLLEECAVCYLQILLSDSLRGFGAQRALADMDAWGYSFRLGSAKAWFETDASDAKQWLETHQRLPLNASM